MFGTQVPIDSLICEMKRGRSYTLGLGRATDLSDAMTRTWPSRVAASLCGKTQRSTLLVETEGSGPLEDAVESRVMESPAGETSVTKIVWTVGPDSTRSSPSWDRQSMKALGIFPKWKEQYSLLILHLGSLDSGGFAMLGKLCDGIALAADLSRSEGMSLKRMAGTLREHQSQGCRLLGMWSVEIG